MMNVRTLQTGARWRRTLQLTSNALHVTADPARLRVGARLIWGRPSGTSSGWHGKETGIAAAAFAAVAMTPTLCEALEEQESKEDESDGCELYHENDDNDSISIYFDKEYEPKNLLGCGTFGVVMQCVHKQTGRVAAVKMVQDLPGNKAEVEREKTALKRLERAGGHENIAGYEGSYYHNDFHYVVLEYVPGISLHSFMEKHRTLCTTWALKLVAQLSNALSFMHAADIIHRDLKPENIMALVNEEGKSTSCGDVEDVALKIIDLGSAGRISVPESSEKACSTTLSGTRCYWPPEVLQRQDMTAAMDMWALGCILYILISGRHPFDLTGCSTEDQVLHRIATTPVSFLLPVWHDVPLEIKELIHGLLEKDPHHRLTAEQVLEHPAIIEATKATTFSAFSVRREVSEEDRSSRERYLHLLQQLDREEYGEPALKKRKKSSMLPMEREDHAYEQKKHNKDIIRRLHKELSGRRNVRIGGAVNGKMAKLTMNKNKQVADEKKEEGAKVDSEKKDFTSNGVEESKMPKKYQDEIAELEEKLQAQRLSRTSKADRLFYSRLGERETSTIVEEVLLEELYELTGDVFDEEEEKSRNKELPLDLLEEVEDALHEGPMEEILVNKYNVDITRHHLQCLLPGTWLNDEIINFYFQMMSDRDEELVKSGVLEKRSHFFNSFFYTKVSEGGYNFINVRRWTRKIDLFSMDKIFMPVNVGNMHWCMAAIFMTEKRIQYFDSMGGAGTACLNVLLRYLRDESEHKKKQKFDDEGWELVSTMPNTPSQTNGSDCGVFSCMFADYLSQGLPLSFTQRDIPFHRHRMVLHISRGCLPLDEEDL
ncbi:hypothetical protein BBO99_00001644 [Phytophthora kernoviae]|uniref:Protein kinase domain-containing protein n=2 Tax=Phytophthora kernoviae TaxID=325452 RepID=A0A3R7HMD8_9STRA|nr:hypothetical protein G195_002211 [Phytophthora kernoviae 00238/432]KAG2531249.1 hypothetical protein JM16_001174 [Phytophthora kernoviae]KAG2531868.1 hypothetical protein JM18_001561 [Phytophthora kernoviae]RLN45687.1 hypothetical protein BBI17_001414 [Phytophthora kernoviae]RLN84013.1 hypothetical protein BBO99_00001644 [Phytophthora kernoviae]